MLFCKDLNVSVYSNLLVIFFIAFCNALLQYYLVKVQLNHKTFNNEEELLRMCEEAHLSQIATGRVIEHLIYRKTIEEIARKESVEMTSIKQSIRRSKRKLGL